MSVPRCRLPHPASSIHLQHNLEAATRKLQSESTDCGSLAAGPWLKLLCATLSVSSAVCGCPLRNIRRPWVSLMLCRRLRCKSKRGGALSCCTQFSKRPQRRPTLTSDCRDCREAKRDVTLVQRVTRRQNSVQRGCCSTPETLHNVGLAQTISGKRIDTKPALSQAESSHWPCVKSGELASLGATRARRAAAGEQPSPTMCTPRAHKCERVGS